MKEKLYYLASPYSHPFDAIRSCRYRQALKACDLISERYGIVIISPIVYGHQFAESFGRPTDAEYWKRFNDLFMKKSDAMIVLQLEGWRDSVGIQYEIKYFKTMKKKIGYINEVELERLQADTKHIRKIRTKP